MKTFVFYHNPCPDGVFGALCAHISLMPAPVSVPEAGATAENSSSSPANFIPISYSTPVAVQDQYLQRITRDDVVYMIDCIGPPGFLLKACAAASLVRLLDHHQTALTDLDKLKSDGKYPKNLVAVMDMNRSGAVIALDHFSILALIEAQLRRDGGGEAKCDTFVGLQRKIALVEDNDLWRHKLENSKAFYTGLGEMKIDYSHETNPGVFQQLLDLDVDATIELGIKATAEREIALARILKKIFLVDLKDESGKVHKCLMVYCKDHKYTSDLGHRLSELGRDMGYIAMGAVARQNLNGDVSVSLRSLYNAESCPEGVDTTLFSKHRDGGGHKGASGFVTQERDFLPSVVELAL